MKLGRNPSRHDARTLRLADFVNIPSLPASPMARDWTERLPENLGMMQNDVCGDCGYAAPAHLVQVWSSNRGQTATITDTEIVAAYSRDTGYVPGQPQTDQGASMLDVCKAWRTLGIGGHQVGAFVRVDARNQEEVQLAVSLFGGVYVGGNLPLRAQAQLGATWTTVGPLMSDDAVGSWGGHAMACAAYDRTGPWLLTWGRRQRATWQWWGNYVDEVYALLSSDWVAGTAPAPSGVDVAGLNDALQRIAA